MRILSVQVEGFRCLGDLRVDLDNLTVLVGANGAGKSSLLHAIRWFFEGDELDDEDLTGHDPDRLVRVGVTFGDLTSADREALGKYATGDTATFWREWSPGTAIKLTGRAFAYPPFEAIRVIDGARDLTAAYRELSATEPGLGLPAVRSADAARDAMDDWEHRHPGSLEPAEISATHLFGFVGQARLAGRFDVAFVPAVADTAKESRDTRGTLLRQIVERILGDQTELHDQLRDLQQQVAGQVRDLYAQEHQDVINDLSHRLTEDLQVLVPGALIRLTEQPVEPKLTPPSIHARVGDDDLVTEIDRQGHGIQRSLFFTLAQQLAVGDGDPSNDTPALLVMIEEPELYQHPVQARHFATVLSSLPRSGAGAIQVAYATHNEHFVDARHFENLRRFGKLAVPGFPCPVATVTRATVDQVATRLEGVVPIDQVRRRIDLTVSRSLGEAFFARAVLLVEGLTDEAVYSGIADRSGGFDKAGISVVPIGGKTLIAVAFVVLTELGIPHMSSSTATWASRHANSPTARLRRRPRRQRCTLPARTASYCAYSKPKRPAGRIPRSAKRMRFYLTRWRPNSRTIGRRCWTSPANSQQRTLIGDQNQPSGTAKQPPRPTRNHPTRSPESSPASALWPESRPQQGPCP